MVLWLCKKQSGVSLSTMDTEFISASQAGREILGMKKVMNELKLRVREHIPMWIDNQAESEKNTSSDKYVDIRCKFMSSHTKINGGAKVCAI